MQSNTPLFRGFSLLELMIVITIISILSAVALPSYQRYTARARFIEIITTANAFKTAVTLALQEGFPLNEMAPGEHGIPDSPSATKHLSNLTINNGVITATASETLHHLTYILQPNLDGSLWTVSGSCLKAGLCYD